MYMISEYVYVKVHICCTYRHVCIERWFGRRHL